jgi:hypothetical protein
MKDEIARVRIDSETGQFLDISLSEKGLRFRCKKCAIYCCKLGGPFLTKEDIAQIESVGYKACEFVEDSKRKYGELLMTSAMKNREDGSRVFLRLDEKEKLTSVQSMRLDPYSVGFFPLRSR